MDKITKRKIEWNFEALRFLVSANKVVETEDMDAIQLLNDSDRIIADETVDDEIDKANFRKETEEKLGEDDGKWGEL